MTRSAQAKEMMIMPIQPKTVKAKDISDTTAPVSPFCCSSIKLALGGRVMLPANVAGIKDSANSHGLLTPIKMISKPLTQQTAKLKKISLLGLMIRVLRK